MRPQQIIAKKRDGSELTAEEIGAFIRGVCDASWADYQISALVMAMFIRGLNEAEGEMLVREMLHSGEVLDFSDIDKPKADKHSTGGVGDKCSLIIAPVVAACGVAVPMISGRGLGHTGGTLDKLESIPGYNVNLSTRQFRDIIGKCGFAMAGQTADIAPADKKLYALRDATATVPYIPLIVASIMSKKLAEGLDALVLDVKTGSGAFMQEQDDAVALAKAMVNCGEKFGVRTTAVISNMDQPLGQYIGNAYEVAECVDILSGHVSKESEDTFRLSVELAAMMLVNVGVAPSVEAGRGLATDALLSGKAWDLFVRNIELQGGDPNVIEDRSYINDTEEYVIESQISGYLKAIDTAAIGDAICALGGGRTKAEDLIDHSVGIANEVKIGDRIERGEPLATVFCRSREQFDAVQQKLSNAYLVGPDAIQPTPLILKIIP